MDPLLLAEARRTAALTDTRLHLVIPSVLATGETFALRISAMGADALPPSGFCHRLVFEGCTGIDGLPEAVLFATDGGCPQTIEGLRAIGPEVALVRARVEGTGMHGGDPVVASNPAWVFPEPGYRLYWGDLHAHTSYSNCNSWSCLDPEFCYQYAQEVALLDFAAAADHLRGIASAPERWPRLRQLARQYDAPGGFVPFLAFESSHAKGFGGDNNVYYRGLDGPFFWIDREDMRGIAPRVHLRELWAFLDRAGQDYLTVPHHTARKAKNRTFDEDYHDPRREPLFEVYSGWGSSEARPGPFPLAGGNSGEAAYLVDALRAGCRFGVIASSDDHATHPGGMSRHRGAPLGLKTLTGYHHQGLAAVRARELTRDALWAGMTRRATYATTLSRTLVDVRLGDACMGEELALGAADPLRRRRCIEVRLTPDGPADARLQITLVRNGVELATQTASGSDLSRQRTRLVFEDEEPFAQAAIRGATHHREPFLVYYIRVSDASNFTQWTSPIWLDDREKGPA